MNRLALAICLGMIPGALAIVGDEAPTVRAQSRPERPKVEPAPTPEPESQSRQQRRFEARKGTRKAGDRQRPPPQVVGTGRKRW